MQDPHSPSLGHHPGTLEEMEGSMAPVGLWASPCAGPAPSTALLLRVSSIPVGVRKVLRAAEKNHSGSTDGTML